MRILLSVVLILCLGLVSSCTSPAGIVVDASKLYSDNPDASTVMVMRKSQLGGATLTAAIALDGEVIAHLGPGDRVEFQVQPGEHYVAVEIFGNYEVIRFDAGGKKTYYFYYSLGGIMAEQMFKLEQLTAIRGKGELAANKYELLTAGQ